MTRLGKLSALLLLIGLCLLLPLTAQAITLGERSYGECDDVTLTSSSSVADILDWLDDFLDDEVGAVMGSTTDLMEMIELVQSDSATAPQLPDTGDYYKSSMEVYTQSCDVNSEISFYYDKLCSLYAQCSSLRDQIKSGEFTKDTIDEMKRELDVAAGEITRLSAEAVAKQSGWKSSIGALQTGLTSAAQESTPLPYLAAVRALAQPLLHKQASDIASQENTGTDAPIVTVISDKEIAFTALYKNERGENVGIPGVTFEVWQVGKPETKKTKQTDKEGVIVLWAADFKPDSKGFIELELNLDGSTATNGKKYQKREMGRIYIRNGRSMNFFPKEDNGKPYLIRATMDNLDMLSIDNGYALSRNNNIDHTLELKMDTKGKPNLVKLWHYNSSAEVFFTTLLDEKFVANDTTTHKITRKWLQYGVKGALPDKNLAPYFSIYIGSNAPASGAVGGDDIRDRGSFRTNRSKVEGPVSKEDPKGGDGMIAKIGFALPSDIPFIGGARLDFPSQHNINISVVPGSSYYIGFNHEIKPEKTAWKNQNAKDVAANDEAIKEVGAGKLASTKQGMKEENMRAQRRCFIAQSSLTFTPYFFVGIETPAWESDESKGAASIGLIITYSAEFTKQFHLGPVPAFISLELGASINVGFSLSAEGQIQSDGTIKNMKIKSPNRQFAFNINVHLSASLTCGAGLPRFAYLGLRAAGYIDFTFSAGQLTKKPTLEFYIHADVVVKFLSFSKEWTFWDKKKTIPLGSELQAELLDTSMSALALAASPEPTALTADVSQLGVSDVKDIVKAQNLTIASGDVKYFPISGDTTDAFYISGSTGQTLVWARWTNGSSIGMQSYVNIQSFDPQGNGYIYDFDMDYHNGTYYFIAMINSEPKTTLPGTEFEMNSRAYDQQKDMYCVFGTLSPNSFNNGYAVTLENPGCIQNNICYMPRIKALYTPTRGCTYVIGGIRIGEDQRHIVRIASDPSAKLNKLRTVSSVPTSTVTDLVLLDYLAKYDSASQYANAYGESCLIRLRRKNASYDVAEKLYYEFQSGDDDSLNRVNVDLPLYVERQDYRVGCLGISSQIWWNRGSDTETAFIVAQGFAEKDVPKQELLKQKVGIMFVKRQHGCIARDFFRTMTLKDMGAKSSSDGLHAVTVKLASNSYQVYAYWGESYKLDTVAEPGTEKYCLKACLVDPKSMLCTASFLWFNTPKNLEKIQLLPVVDVTKSGEAFYTEAVTNKNTKTITGWNIHEVMFQMSPDITIRGFGTEYPVVTQGKDFGMYFRVENTGPIVIKSFDVEVKGVNQAKGKSDDVVPIKTLHIDTTNPKSNSVVHHERDASAANYVTTGEHTVYRIEDIRDSYNGELVETTTTTDGGEPVTKTEQLKAFLPGAVQTYKSTVTNSPQKWHGKYALFAKIVKLTGTLALGDYAGNTQDVEIQATWNDTTGKFDVTMTGENGATIDNVGGEPLALFEYDAPGVGNPGNAGTSQTNLVTNDALNSTLTRGDELYADINNNDLVIKADMVTIDNEDFAVINLKNDTTPVSPEVIPKLTAKIVTDDGTEVETYSRTLKTALTGGFSRGLCIPMSELTGGKPCSQVKLYVGSSNGAEYFEVNEMSNVATLTVTSSLAVDGPDDVTVYENDGKDATFKVKANAADPTKITYQWKVVYPDGTVEDLAGETSDTLVISKPKLGQNGMRYRCAVSDGSTVQLSRTATLTVLKVVPITGDGFPTIAIVLLLCLSACGGAWLASRKRRS